MIRSIGTVIALITGVIVGTTTLRAEGAPDNASPAVSHSDSASSASDDNGLGEIVVTAQRRAESLEKTPVAVSVVTAEAMKEQGVFSEFDLQRAVPGLTVRASQNNNQLNFAIRGQTVDAYSSSSSAVVSYFNEVPITPNSTTPFYDLQSIQVLKGPQGTLFGQNATGGAVLFTSAAPTDKLEGYVTARVGNYGYATGEGALNIPIVGDRLALRLAGTIQDREGLAYNLYDDRRVGSILRRAFRASLLAQPADNIHNTTVIDYSYSGGTELPNSAYTAYAPGQTNNGYPLTTVPGILFSPGLDAAIGDPGAWASYLAAHPKAYPGGIYAFTQLQRERGPYTVDVDGSLDHSAKNLVVTNTTAWDLNDQFVVKNIAGYGHSHTIDGADYDGSPYGMESLGQPNSPPWGYELKNRTYTEELQLSKTKGALTFVAGYFYSNFSQDQIRDNVDVFDLSPVIPVTILQIPGINSSVSSAVYAQLNYDLSQITNVSGLSFVAGGRYTTSKESESVSPGNGSYNRPGFANDLSKTFNEPSWQFGLNEQVTPEWLIYGVTRRSFRAGGYNIFAPANPGTAAEGGALYDPEIATDVEIGSKYENRSGVPFRINVAIFDEWVDNIQRTIYANIPNYGLASLTVNVPQAKMRGAELDAKVNPASGLELGGNIAYNDDKFSKNQALVFGSTTYYGPYPDTPKVSWSVYGQYSIPVDSEGTKLSFRPDVYSQTKFYFSSTASTATPGTDLPSYTLVNLRASLDNIRGSALSVAAVARNVTNRVYWVGGLGTASNLSVNTASPGEPRTYYLEANYKF